MAGTFKPRAAWFEGFDIRVEKKVDELDRRILASAKSHAPVGQRPKRGKLNARAHKHMRDTGKIIPAEIFGGIVEGGFEFTAPYTLFVVRGHHIAGAVKSKKRVVGRNFLLEGLEDHRGEIETGEFLKG